MLASTLLKSQSDPAKAGVIEVGTSGEVGSSDQVNVDLKDSAEAVKVSENEYVQLQQHVYLTTVIVSVLLAGITATLFDFKASIGLLFGALLGLIYLRLLARSIGKLGQNSKSVGKIQLIVPVVLVLICSKVSQIELLPSLLGFLLYKPSLIIQVMLESKTKAKS